MRHVPFRFHPLTAALMCLPLLQTWADEANVSNTNEEAEVITVTAQHRSERIQDVPITMNAFNEDDMRNLGALNIKDLGNLTPGVDFSNPSVTQPRFSIRGIGTTDFGIGSDPATAVYIDGVYVGRSGAAQLNFNDIERVEIVKGPQGTLFGRNAAAGAISIITKAPGDTNEATLRLTIGEYNRQQLEASANASNGDNLHLRLSANSYKRDGYIDRVGGGDALGTENDQSARASLLWNASPDTDVMFRADIDRLDQDGPQGASTNSSIAPADPFGAIATDLNSQEKRNAHGFSAEINHRYGDQQLTSITAYRTFTSNNLEDEDGSDNPRVFLATNNEESLDAFSQELRVTGANDKLKWSYGGIYSTEKAKQTSNVLATTNSLDSFFLVSGGVPGEAIPGIPPGFGLGGFFYQALDPLLVDVGGWDGFAGLVGLPDGLSAATAYANLNLGKNWKEQIDDQGDFSSAALYGDVTWGATSKLDVTFGLRYTRDKKTFTVNSAYQNNLDFSGGLVGAGTILQCASDAGGACIDTGNGSFIFPVTDINGIGLPALLAEPVPFGLIFAEQVKDIKNSDSWSSFSPRFVLDYKWQDDFMSYFSVAKGFKAGGFNSLGADTVNNRLESFNPENVINYEAGMKSSWLNNAVILNASVFHYTYKDQQVLALSGAPGTIPTYNISNADAKGDGLEAELTWRVNDAFSIYANWSILDTEYTRYDINPALGQTSADDLTGKELSNMPDKYNLGFDYSVDAFGGNIVWYVNNTHTGSSVNHVGARDYTIGGYDLLNTRLSYQPGSGNWELALDVQNALDEEYITEAGGIGGNLGSAITRRGKPRFANVSFSVTF